VFRTARQQDRITFFKADPFAVGSSQPAASPRDEVELGLWLRRE
jgi:hypothetical protein